MKEKYVDIKGVPYYQISNYGNVRRKAHTISYESNGKTIHRPLKAKNLKADVKMTGNRIDSVSINIKGKKFSIARLVYKHFVCGQDIPETHCIAHKNKDPLDNRSTNLTKVTWSESRVMDHKYSERTIKAQKLRSKKGALAMKELAIKKKAKKVKNK